MGNLMNFWKGVFSDNGSPSFSRVATGFALCFACGWVTAIVMKNHALPDFMGLVAFIGVLYGLNTAGNVGKSYGGKDQQ